MGRNHNEMLTHGRGIFMGYFLGYLWVKLTTVCSKLRVIDNNLKENVGI